MDISFDASQITKLAADLTRSGQTLPQKVRPVVQKGAVNVKAAMREDFKGSTHFAQVARSITYDSREGATFAEAEIGPVTAGQTVGDLAHIAYFGGSPSGGGSVRDPQEALDDEAPKFEKALLDLFEGIL